MPDDTVRVSIATSHVMHHKIESRGTTLRQRAFTLIELLVVIAIIAIVISILVPSLSAARQKAKSTVCLSHLRQLSHGWHGYADENKDIAPPGRYAKLNGGTSNPANWYEVGNGMKYRPRWAAIMGANVGIFAFDAPSTTDDRQDYANKVYVCPTVPDWNDERNASYGYNHQFLGNGRKTNDQFHNFPVNRSQIASFAGTILAGDCMGTAAGLPTSQRQGYSNNGTDYAALGNHGWTLDPPRLTATSDRGSGDADSPRTAVDPRHLTRANVVFCDGHAETQTPETLGYQRQPDGAYVEQQTSPGVPSNAQWSGTGRDDPPPDLPS